MKVTRGMLFLVLAAGAAAAPLHRQFSNLRPAQVDDTTVPGTWSFLEEHAQSGRDGTTVVLVLLFLFCFGPPICILCCCSWIIFAAKKAIGDFRNAAAKDMREKFDAECPADEQDKYNYHTKEGAEFKKRCEDMFAEADKNNDKELDLSELVPIVGKYLGFSDAMQRGGTSVDYPGLKRDVVMEAFDTHKSGSIDKEEFFEMMKYLEWQKDKEAKANEKAT